MVDIEIYYIVAKFCPECGKPLEKDPCSGSPACFLHGDFHFTDGIITWVPTKYLVDRTGKF